jgi:hypothetical protein
MKKSLLILITGLFIIILTACGTEVFASQATLPYQTRYRTNTKTLTYTPTLTNTWVPSSTPTIGPPPDMELNNVAIYPEFGDFNSPGQKYTMLGRVKNNTDQIMIFYERTPIFQFTFESWEFDEFYARNFRHIIYTTEVEQSESYYRYINCFLYPGEEGLFMYETGFTEEKYIVNEFVPEHNGPLGLWYKYEGIYSVDPDLPLDYHPQAENLVFETKNGILNFDYDVQVPNPDSWGYTQLISYIVLVDRQAKIINVLRKDIVEFGGFEHGKLFHVHGTTATSSTDGQHRFVQTRKLTQEMIEQVDHIEVLNEFEAAFTCG